MTATRDACRASRRESASGCGGERGVDGGGAEAQEELAPHVDDRDRAAAHAGLGELGAHLSRRVGVFTVPHDTTIAGVARQLPGDVKMGDVIKLNPALMLNPEVLKGTRVRYYVE